MTVIKLEQYRDFLRDWEEVKRSYLSGQIQGAILCLERVDGLHGIRLFGRAAEDHDAALLGAMRVCIELNRDPSTPGLKSGSC